MFEDLINFLEVFQECYQGHHGLRIMANEPVSCILFSMSNVCKCRSSVIMLPTLCCNFLKVPTLILEHNNQHYLTLK